MTSKTSSSASIALSDVVSNPGNASLGCKDDIITPGMRIGSIGSVPVSGDRLPASLKDWLANKDKDIQYFSYKDPGKTKGSDRSKLTGHEKK